MICDFCSDEAVQLFFALATLFVTVIVGQVAFMKWYVDLQFSVIDVQLKFLIAMAKAEARVK